MHSSTEWTNGNHLPSHWCQTESQMAEQLGNRAINQVNNKVAGSILGRAELHCDLGQGTSPYLPQGGMSLYLL